MAPQNGFHFGAEFLAEHAPVAIIFGVNEQCCNEIDVLDIQPAAGPDQKIGTTVCERKLWLGDAAIVPPGEVSVKVALRIIENKSDTAGMRKAAFKCRSQISLGVATQGIGAEIKCDSQQRGCSGAQSSRRADLNLNLPIAKNRRADELLDAFNQLSCRGGAPNRREHEAQGCTNISEMVDVQNPRGSPKPLNQIVEFLAIVQAMNFEANR